MIRQSLSTYTLNQALGCMKYEWMRLGSFKSFPRQSEGKPIKLAKAGFVFTGTREGDDTVACFTCGVTKNNWLKYDDPFQIHKDLNPRCNFINNTCENVPILVPEPNVYDEILITLHETYCSHEDTGIGITGRHNAKHDTFSFDSLKLDSASLNKYGTMSYKTVKIERINGYTITQDPEITSSASYILADDIARQTMVVEEARLKTFGNWPRYLAVRPTELARAGFYYLGSADRVQCAFCRGILRDWEEAQSPVAEHWRYFSSCEFLIGTDRSNVPVVPNDSYIHDYVSTHPLSPTDVDVRGGLNPLSTILNNGNLKLTQRDAPATAEDLDIITQTAAQPDNAMVTTRTATFANGPRRSSLPSKEQFAEAGFYYLAREDAVKCCYCGGILKSWRDDDIPCQEHAKWFPKCPYLLRIKGQDFVNSIHRPGRGTAKARTTVGAKAGRPMVLPKRMASNDTGENTDDVKDLPKFTCYTAASRLMSRCTNPIKSKLRMSYEKIIGYIEKKY